MKDLIERQAAIDAIESNAYRHTYVDQIIDIIKALPPAQPETKLVAKVEVSKEDIRSAVDKAVARIKAESERKMGCWIDEGTNYFCSECHRGCWVNSDYCPWCGAQMLLPEPLCEIE